ncbi:hypothetical protein DENSPDRAFT_831699 [Dentipellis sp. KUC8613]|nr:hypothetical protein DENSPDRAFT_831699 [Dentipellis sp. KUC8613]
MPTNTFKGKCATTSTRVLKSVPAPLEADSDSDFAPGAYVYETPKKRGRKPKASPRERGKKRSRRNDVLDMIGGGVPRKKLKRSHVPSGPNPLLEIFGDGLGIDFASSDEEGADDEKAPADEVEEEEDEEDEDEDEDASRVDASSPVRISATMPTSPVKARTTLPPRVPVEDDGSVTESDEDLPPPTTLPQKRPIPDAEQAEPPSKRPQVTDDSVTESDSVTEPESDWGVPPQPQKALPQNGRRPPTDDDSVTESESECEATTSILQSATQTSLIEPNPDDGEPFVLDATHHISVPPSLNKYLREYQREGVKFFFERYVQDRGAVLGDDMGLGKTIQVISFLSALMQKTGTARDVDRRRKYVSKLQDRREWKESRTLPPPDERWPTALIVAPSSVVGVWAREFVKWGHFEVGLFIGPPGEREDVLNDFKMGRLDVVITSFDTARRSIDLIDSLPWTVLIIDEAHRLKNPRSQSTLAFSSFAWAADHPIPKHITQFASTPRPVPSTAPGASSSKSKIAQPEQRIGPIRIALTGTAIQNSYLELWTLLDWANPGSVGSISQWKKCVMDPLMAGQAKGSKEEERIRATRVAQTLRDKLLPRFFLRRTKDIIKDQLPKKTDEVVFCPLTPKQIEVYKRILATDAVQNMIRKEERCDCGSRKKRKECCHPFKTGDLFKYMSTLIKISNHLALILPAPTDNAEQTLRNRELCEIAFPGGDVPKYGPAMLVPKYCGKWMVLETLLREWRKDPSNKVLIFTKSVKLLDMLTFHLDKQNYGFVKLEGSTKQSDRMPLIDQFQNDPDIFIFLISTLAGGTGLNLTGANKVVVFDPNWNPAHDLQAMDRAYRFGQTRDVSVYRLLGAGSIEELIYARQVYKQQQMAIGYEASVQTRYFSGISGDKSRQGELFGLQNIFKLHENTSTTKMAIERANLINLDWALAHMDAIKSKKPRKKGGAAEDWVYEAEAKDTKDDEELKGLGALLLDDTVPEVEKNDVSSILNSYGIKYSHRNDDILAPSHIEEAKLKNVIKEKRKQARKAKEKKETPEKSPEPEWPPRRRHHKPPPSPKSKLLQRQMALLDLGIIQSPGDLNQFASDFMKSSPEEQNELLARLDAHKEKRRRM